MLDYGNPGFCENPEDEKKKQRERERERKNQFNSIKFLFLHADCMETSFMTLYRILGCRKKEEAIEEIGTS